MTKYIKVNNINEQDINEVANALKNGKLVVFPTDTVYGIGSNAYDEDACERIYEVKGRPKYKPLVLLIADISMLNELVDKITPVEQKLMDTFWPGSLTIKLKKKKGVLPDIISAGDEYLRARLLPDGLMKKIIFKAGVPVVAPSANISGGATGTQIDNIISDFDGKVDYILDSGDIESDITSTIVEVEDEKVIIIREGKITKNEIAKIALLK